MRFTLPYNLYRLMGISGLFLIAYIVVIGVFGNTDISWLLPQQFAASLQEAWPRMPFFAVEKKSVDDGKEQEIYYTVPTRQLTQLDLMRMGVTNSLAHPAAPK